MTVFCALDTDDLEQARQWAKTIGPLTGGLKLGLEFINSHGPQGIEAVKKACPDAALFIDLKFHDIPNTVAGAVRAVCRRFSPAYLNVHASGGLSMMQAAMDALEGDTRLLAVTVLTSIDEAEFSRIGYINDLATQAAHFALLAQEARLHGVVCSAHEIENIRRACGPKFDLMVPGIRPGDAGSDDQKRIMTPARAMQKGATHLVVGRPITGATDPAAAAAAIVNQLGQEGF